jgi:hypothetical protein
MTGKGIKTRDEHRQYIRAMTRLSFFFGYNWWLKHAAEESISHVLRDRTPLFHHALNVMRNEGESHPPWQSLLARAEALAPAQEFEDRLFADVREFADGRADRFYPESVGIRVPPDWNAGSLKYDNPADRNLPANHCNFHIANAVAPKSIFADPEYLPHCFIDLMDGSERDYGCDTLRTFTWLNDEPRWLRLFPQEWHDNLGPRSDTVSWNFGHWGQLVTARGTFNEKAGQYVREHGELRYRPRASHCSFRAMREHLQKLLDAGGAGGRWPNVGGGLRTATKRQAGLCPATPSGGPKAPPRDFVALWFLPYGRIARDSLHLASTTVGRAVW